MQTFGWIGFVLFQAFYFPQTLRMLRTRDVGGLSLYAWALLWTALACNVIYAAYISDVVFLAGSAAGLAQTSLQIGLMLLFRMREEVAVSGGL